MANTEYKVISANNSNDLQRELKSVTTAGFKPILLTSTAVGDNLVIVAIVEHRTP
jgi:hypothetical protein